MTALRLIEAMLNVVALTASAESGEARARAFAASIGNVIDLDYAVYCEHDAASDLPLRVTVTPGFVPIPDTWPTLVTYAAADPWLSHVRRTADLGARRWEDVATATQLAGNPLVQELYRPAGSRHVLNAPVRWGSTVNTMVTLSRGGSTGFSDTERELLEVLCRAVGRAVPDIPAPGPAGISAGAIAADGDDRGGLTHRQHDVADLIAGGYTNSQIARRLGISERTARKHVSDVCARLGVTNRTAAAARWARRRSHGGASAT